MEADLQSYVAFYLTGKKQPSQLDEIAGLNLRPVLFSGYRDLTRLRYDFPLVLNNDLSAGRIVEPLSGLIDEILARVANGPDGERVRKHVLRLEQEIRLLLSQKEHGLLSELWDKAAARLEKQEKQIADSLSLARVNLKIDGEMVDCSADLSSRLLGHAWGLTQMQRANRFNDDIKRLILKLSDILESDFVNSDAGKTADQLRHAFGSGPLDNFNFDAMSRMLKKMAPRQSLSKSRRQRVNYLITTLQSQKFFPSTATKSGAPNSPYCFAFETCSAALKAYQERLPKAIELAKAIAMAELEIKGEYSEEKHDPLFDSFGENGLDTQEMTQFPDYLVRLNATSLSGPEQSTLTQILSADLPIKILVQSDDILEESLIKNGHMAFTLRSKQLARMAMGIGVFVLQSPASNLLQMLPQMQKGLDVVGPALFSIFSGDSPNTAGFPPYLVGAAAQDSRLFPAFTFNPAAGNNWAARFSFANNAQIDKDWPIHDLVYQDERCQSVSLPVPFTLIDFIVCDKRYSKHFARVPRQHWSDFLVPVTDTLSNPRRSQLEAVPFLWMVDDENKLQKVLVDEMLIREARRCQSMWNSLQELGGINNSHAIKLLASERKLWEETSRAAASVAGTEAATPATPVSVAASAPAVAEAEAERSADEAYIETARCASCNECIQINDKMFAYDGNQQASITDLNAGTYAQLVEAAENCQVAIIHPGKPRNPNEPGLEELLKRAEAFI